MKIIIVDDDPAKSDRIEEVLRSQIGEGHDVDIVIASNLSTAVQALVETKFDLIILDLMIPFIKDGIAEIGAGLDLLRFVRKRGGKNSESFTVGLSAFPEQVASAYSQFERNGVLIVEYDLDGKWAEPVNRILQSAISHDIAAPKLDFVIMVALDEERSGYEYARVELGSCCVIAGMNVQYAKIDRETGTLNGAIVRCRQMGLVAAVVDTARAISIFRPSIVAMSGICAGYSKEVKLGQLVLGSPAWEYQAGKWTDDGFEIAPLQVQLRASTRTKAEQIMATDRFVASIEEGLPFEYRRPAERTKPKLAPAVTGSAVIADSQRLDHIIVQHRKIAAIDMETYGVYYACHEAIWHVDHYLSIKTVVDLADKNKSDSLHQYGCVASARAVTEIIRALDN
jgi:adenosylhomocysteine nucleosidase